MDDNVIEMMTMIKMMKMMLAYSSQAIESDKAVYTYEVSYIGGRAKCTPRTKRGGHCHLASAHPVLRVHKYIFLVILSQIEELFH